MDVEVNPGPGILSVFHWNARSVRNKIDFLSDIADEYDIICVTETHLDANVLT